MVFTMIRQCGYQISNEDLPRIQEEMMKIVKENFPSERREVTKEEAFEIFKNDPYKLELIQEHSDDEGGLTIYTQGEYVDLCRGPHVCQQAVSRFLNCSTWLVHTGVVRAKIQ